MQVDFGVVSEGKPYFFTQFHKIDLDIWSHLIDREREREREREIHLDPCGFLGCFRRKTLFLHTIS